MNMKQNPEERLWDYIDGLSSPQEKSVMQVVFTIVYNQVLNFEAPRKSASAR